MNLCQSRLSFALTSISLFAGMAFTANAQVVNDDCTGAITLLDGQNGPFSSVGATSSPNLWLCGLLNGRDVWFVYRARCTGTTTIETCGSNFDTVLDVHTGVCPVLVPLLICNDNACGSQSRVSFPTVANLFYYIRVGGKAGASGNIQLNVDCVGAPANDECFDALPIDVGLNGPYSNFLALPSVLPLWSCGLIVDHDVWFKFTADASADFTFDTCTGTNFNTVIELFEGGCLGLNSLGCNNDNCGVQSSLTRSLNYGQEYLLRVGGLNNLFGEFNVRVTPVQTLPNDEPVGATPVFIGPNGPFDNNGATTTRPRPSCSPDSACDVWFVHRAICDGQLTVDTCGAPFDTVLAAYSGTPGSLVEIGCNDDAPGCGTASRLVINVIPGQDYYFGVSGRNCASGSFFLNVSYSGGIGDFSTIATGCGSIQLVASGVPSPAGVVNFSMTGVEQTPYMWVGFEIGPFPLCPPNPCALGADFMVVLVASSFQMPIPCDPLLIGGRLATQGADLKLFAGSCPQGADFLVELTDTIVTTIR